MAKFYEFDQNNSGGSFDIDDGRGIGPRVWVEANSPTDANARAEQLGIYFDGCESGMDCSCCGDRWHSVWQQDQGEDAPKPNPEYDFNWHDTIYVHRIDGSIERIRSDG